MSDLFDAAAERLAFSSGRSRSQELAELRAPNPRLADETPLFARQAPRWRPIDRFAVDCEACGPVLRAKCPHWRQ